MNEESRKIIEKLRSLKPYLQEEMGIKRLRVFGSVARGEAEPDSDVDLIVDFDDMPGFEYFSMPESIGKRLGGRDVDICFEDTLHPLIKKRALREARDV